MKREGKKISWNLFEKVWFRFADCRRNRSFRKGQFGEQPSFNIYDLKVCIFLLFFFFWREKDSPFVESCWERVNRSRRFTTNTYTPLSRPGIVSDWLLKTYVFLALNDRILLRLVEKKLDEIWLIPIFREYISRMLDRKKIIDRVKINRENTYSTFIKRKIIRIDRPREERTV